MNSLQSGIVVDVYALVEHRVCSQTQDFMDRLLTIQVTPVENEADMLMVSEMMSELISDMQAFTIDLDEGPQRGFTELLRGTGPNCFVEITKASIAERAQGEESPSGA